MLWSEAAVNPPECNVSTHTDNELCEDDDCPDGIALQPYLHTTGALVDIRTGVYTHEISMPSGGIYDYPMDS